MDQADKDDIRIYYRDVQEIDQFTDIDPADAILKVWMHDPGHTHSPSP